MSSLPSLLSALDAAVAENDGSSYTDALERGLSLPSAADRRSLAIRAVLRASGRLPVFVSPASTPGMELALQSLPAGTTLDGAADSAIRESLFSYYVDVTGDYVAAARVLGGKRMDDDPGAYFVDPAGRADAWLRVAECYLAADPSAHLPEADSAVTRAGQVVDGIPPEASAIIVRYRGAVARVLDLNRKFGDAGARYYELSRAEGVCHEDLLRLLGQAIQCGVLARDGRGKRRLLSAISKDGRVGDLDAVPEFSMHSAVLRTMSAGHIVRGGAAAREWSAFVSSLAPHQKIRGGDGLTIPERTLLEHNMVAAGKIYKNVYLDELAALLGVSRDLAERNAAGMIRDGRLGASIDQVDGLLTFHDGGKKDGAAGPPVGEGSADAGVIELLRWDDAITAACVQLNKITEVIEASA